MFLNVHTQAGLVSRKNTSGHTVHATFMEDTKSKALHADKLAEQSIHSHCKSHCISTKLSCVIHGVYCHVTGYSGHSRED